MGKTSDKCLDLRLAEKGRPVGRSEPCAWTAPELRTLLNFQQAGEKQNEEEQATECGSQV